MKIVCITPSPRVSARNRPRNPIKEKKLTNIRAAGHDEAIRLTPPRVMTLDTALEWIDEEELVELTPDSVRLRNKILKTALRGKHRAAWSETVESGAAGA